MAMLAEPRQRKRYNLTPRGKPLYNDSDRYGTKMLEKMGWSKGKGLGANEDGSQDFVRVQYKNDFRGMGYEDRDDHWTQHEQSFSSLLDNLNGKGDQGKENNANASDDEMAPRIGFGFVDTAAATKEEGKKLKEKFSGESLEEKSKRSRARVHYKKFTRGKDLAQYSEKDLANIFGRKESDSLQYPQLEAFNANVEAEEETKEEEKPEETKQVEHFSGVTTISTGLSLNDYFKQKMEALKKRKMQNGEQTKATESEEAAVNGQSDSQEEVPKKKKNKSKEPVVENGVEPEEASEPTKKEKKKKKAKESEPLPASVETSENPEEEQIPKKKKKKNKDSSKDQEQVVETQEEKEKAGEVVDEPPPKKKKSKKSKDDVEEVDKDIEEQPPKNKSKKSKENVEEVAKEEPQIQADNTEGPPKKKSKKEKREEPTEVPESVTVAVEEESSKKAKKKKAREEECEEISKKKNKVKEESVEAESVTSQESQKKSKKKKNKEKEEIAAEIVTISDEEEEKPKKKKKDKKKVEETNSTPNEVQEENADGEPARKVKKKAKESGVVDSPAESEGSVADEQPPEPSLKAVSDLADHDDPHGTAPLERAKQNENVHTINTFHAELFRFADLPQFDGSNIGDIVGYAMHDQMELQIYENSRRDNDVAAMWMSCAKSKYDVELRRKRRAREKTTDVRKLKRKQVFLGI